MVTIPKSGLQNLPGQRGEVDLPRHGFESVGASRPWYSALLLISCYQSTGREEFRISIVHELRLTVLVLGAAHAVLSSERCMAPPTALNRSGGRARRFALCSRERELYSSEI